MSNATVTKSLAKVLVAAAWADGVITNEEINSLKDVLFHLPGMTAQDWAEIDIYVESPVDAAERQRLVENLQAQLSSSADKAAAIQALDHMVQAGGDVGASEQAVVDEIKAAIQNGSHGPTAHWSRFTKSSVQRQSQAVQNAPNRELYLDDFVKNKIFYLASQRLQGAGSMPQIPEDELRKLSLAGGLMARIAYVDRQVTDAEYQEIVRVLQQTWGISPAAAAVVAEVAVSEIGKDLDFYRLSRQFFESTTEDERVRFLDVLFAITISDGHASDEEIEEIRTIANGLLLSHEQFIAAKLKVPRDLRMTDL